MQRAAKTLFCHRYCLHWESCLFFVGTFGTFPLAIPHLLLSQQNQNSILPSKHIAVTKNQKNYFRAIKHTAPLSLLIPVLCLFQGQSLRFFKKNFRNLLYLARRSWWVVLGDWTQVFSNCWLSFILSAVDGVTELIHKNISFVEDSEFAIKILGVR